MDHPSDASRNTTIQNCISKLFTIETIVTYLGFQLKEVSACLIDTGKQMDPERLKAEDIALMSLMSTQEMMVMVNIENERQGVMEAWRRLEARKQDIIRQAKSRINPGRAEQ